MNAGMFVIHPDGKLLELSETPYDSEAVLQGLLAQYPSLMAGHQFDAERPRRWLLVMRELGIPGGERQSSRWSLDHLFLDQDGTPTLVEVKRSTDTRIRREVVGQMLDYAANAVAYWPAERLQIEFEATTAAAGLDPEVVLRDFLGAELDVDVFWGRAKTNLQAGRIRLVFVADEIPLELRRIIEFLNQQMDPAEVLGVEIKQFSGAGIRSLVPRVVGQTAEAEQRKGNQTSGRQWDADSFFAILNQRNDPTETQVARRILDWAEQRGLRVWWGRGVKDASFYPLLDHDGRAQYTVAVRTGYAKGYVQLQLGQMVAPFDQGEKKVEFVARLQAAVGLPIPSDAKYPSLRLSELGDDRRVAAFLEVLDWAIEETRASG
jgi:hypothetical protein